MQHAGIGQGAPIGLAIGAAAAGLMGWTGVAVAAPEGGYADLVEQVAPAVVFIEVTQEADTSAASDVLPFGPGTPFEDFLERFGIPLPELPSPEAPGPMTGVGSGFIIEEDGTIVTNNHVVANAEEVMVRLDDGRSFEAEVIGTDPMTDLALLKIEASEDLPSVEWGDSGEVRPGDNVVAVGSPFGLGGTVTAGIVSGVARNINAGPYDEFIQTDAAINRGNSGGPLFNEEGEVIGVNTAIFSPTGGSVGVSFAVPSNLAREVIADLEGDGQVQRGFLGVQLQPLTPELADALALESDQGALVAEVTPDSPAEAAGLQSGDVIVRFAGQAVEDTRALSRVVAATDPGEQVEVEVVRDGEPQTLQAELATLDPERVMAGATGTGQDGAPEGHDAPQLGLSVAPLEAETRALAEIGEDVEGVIVTEVDPDGPSAGEIRSGDVIVSIQNRDVATPEALAQAIEDESAREALLLRIWRNGDEQFVAIRPRAA